MFVPDIKGKNDTGERKGCSCGELKKCQNRSRQWGERSWGICVGNAKIKKKGGALGVRSPPKKRRTRSLKRVYSHAWKTLAACLVALNPHVAKGPKEGEREEGFPNQRGVWGQQGMGAGRMLALAMG